MDIDKFLKEEESVNKNIKKEYTKWIIKAYTHLRKTDNSIPDEVLDFIKEAALEKLERMY